MKTNIRIKKLIYTKNIIIFVKKIKNYFQFIQENVNKSDMVMSASDLLKKDYATNLKFEGKWKDILGDISPDFTMMVSGAPGSGKTTFLLEFAYYMASNFGKVLYISSEEYGSVTLAEKLEDIIKHKGLHKEDESGVEKSLIPQDLFFGKSFSDLTDFNFIIVDSVNDIYLDLMDFREIRNIYPDKGFVLVLQTTKQKDEYRGGKDWEHEVDIALFMKNGKINMFKNRYGEFKCYDYFNDESIDCEILDDDEK
jgi:predicted ATP-dependent serine protease